MIERVNEDQLNRDQQHLLHASGRKIATMSRHQTNGMPRRIPVLGTTGAASPGPEKRAAPSGDGRAQ